MDAVEKFPVIFYERNFGDGQDQSEPSTMMNRIRRRLAISFHNVNHTIEVVVAFEKSESFYQ